VGVAYAPAGRSRVTRPTIEPESKGRWLICVSQCKRGRAPDPKGCAGACRPVPARAARCKDRAAFVFVGRDLRLADRCRPVQASINTAFAADPPSSPVQPDAGKQRLLAVSLLYTEGLEGEALEQPLTAREVAQALRIGVDAVRALCRRGMLEHFRVSNAIRVSREELERFIREHTKRRRAREMIVEVGRSGAPPARRGRR
jgi:excisionase family DNA binding protein